LAAADDGIASISSHVQQPPRKETVAMARLWALALLVVTALAWMRFVENPTKRNLLAAIRASLGL
jgi:hypothetical protein